MAGPFDKINSALTGNGHTTSGLDAAMQEHADKVHPTSDTRITKSADKPKYTNVTAPPGGYALHLPSDDQ